MTSRWFLLACLSVAACNGLAVGAADDDDVADGDADSDVDSDADSDSDSDADADTDADSDADADSDVDSDETTDRSCADGADNDQNGLYDCEDPSCARLTVCCEAVAEPLFTDDFASTLDLVRWKPFGEPSVLVSDSLLRPAGDDAFESGIVSLASYPLDGTLEVSGTLRVTGACDGCQELIGLALTATSDYAGAAAVDPIAGVVLDVAAGELLAVVQGVVETSILVEDVQAPQSVAVVIGPDRHVTFLGNDRQLLYTSAFAIDPALTDLYAAVYGRGGQLAGVDDVSVQTRRCSVPSAGRRVPAPVLIAEGRPFPQSAVRAPSVVVSPEGGLEMLFTGVDEAHTGIGRALSGDGGRTWTADPPDTAVIDNATLPFGRADADDPALAVDGLGLRLAAVSTALVSDASARAIVLFQSEDGVSWELVGEPVPLPEYCRSARDPDLQIVFDGSLQLLFSCEDADGRTSLARSTSDDRLDWRSQAGPVLEGFGPGELDGIAAPTVVIDPESLVQELWYEARDGFVRTIRYAVSPDGFDWTRWDGEVLLPGAPGAWDELAVSAPAAVRATEDDLLLFYTGLGAAGQAIGLVDRPLPLLQ